MAERIDGVQCQKKRKHSTDGSDDGSESVIKPENVDDESDDDIESVITPEIEIDPGFLPSDVVLVVEDRLLHVNKDLLIAASPVFAAWLKKEWQNDKGEDNTTTELLFPGKSYHDMITFLKCLLPFFPDILTDETLDTVLPLADEYQVEVLITECEEVIRQCVESVSKTDTYIPPSRIVTYLLWVDQFKLHTVKEYVVRLASYLKREELEVVPEYDNVSTILQRDISNARAELLGGLFVSNATEAEGKMYRLQIPLSARYMTEWKHYLSNIVAGALHVLPAKFGLWKKEQAAFFKGRSSFIHVKQIAPELAVIFACMSISDRFNFSNIYAQCIQRLKSLTINKENFRELWSTHHPTDINNERTRMERHVLNICPCT